MAKQLQYRRLVLLALLLGVAFAGLGYRLVDLQVLRHEELSAKARREHAAGIPAGTAPGRHSGCEREPAGDQRLRENGCADPALIGNRQAEVARAVAPLLQVERKRAASAAAPRLGRNAKGAIITNHYVVLKRKVPVETWQKIQMAMTNLSFGLDEKKLPRAEQSILPRPAAGGDLCGEIGRPVAGVSEPSAGGARFGLCGHGRARDQRPPVAGDLGQGRHRAELQRQTGRSARLAADGNRPPGRELVALREQDVEPHDGLNVVLTIDSVVQHIVESALAEAMEKHSPISISGIVVRPRTGEILAMATLPNFDPNNPGRRVGGRAAQPGDRRRGGAGIHLQDRRRLRRTQRRGRAAERHF